MMNEKRFNMSVSVVMAVLSVLIVIPFVVMLTTSFKTMDEIFRPNMIFIPHKWIFTNYLAALRTGQWGRYFFNSFLITTVSVVVSLMINSIAGFAFARLDFKGRNILFYITLIGLMVPQQVTMIPVFLILKHIPLAGGNNIWGEGGLGWIDSYMGLIIPYIAGSFGVFLFRQFYMNFPKSLDDAARIDGLTDFKTYLYIYLPLSKPVLATLIVLKTTSVWNEYTWPLIITVSDKMKTVQLALTLFRDEATVQWNLMMAATTLIVLPLVIIFLTLQKYFVQGIVTTGIKG
jgi:multiple sugar transport system permease protein